MKLPANHIQSLAELRACYPPVIERARLKTLRRLDKHCLQFISLSPLLCLGTSGESGSDVTPRGDRPGFVHVLDDTTIAIPDWRGNNRLDSLANIVTNPQVGLLFFIPGVDETLRINGAGVITQDPELIDSWNVDGKHPATVLVVTVQEAYFHCGKALIRSRLWHDTYKIERSALPSYGQILKDEIDVADSTEEIEQSVADSYCNKLY